MTTQEYRAAPGLNASRLKAMLISPAHFQSDKSFDETIEMRLGSYVDAWVTENRIPPYVIKPAHKPGDSSDKWHGAKKWCKDWLGAQKPGVEIFSEEEFERALGMVNSLSTDPLVLAVFASCPQRQLPVFADYRGHKMKGLLDLVGHDENGRRVIYDLKTTTERTDFEFAKHAHSLSYDMQGVMYANILAVAESLGERPIFSWVIQESKSPYTVRVRAMPEEAWVNGQAKLDRCLELYERCIAENDWPEPGREPGEAPSIKPLPWPNWAAAN
ncbi:MAG: hypothetical protein E6Q97_23850 [Desulfurellales bacterium]|nr:MAG: hypothetical protein E6Q97_23850 [Desulfurellales bacterium]